MRKIRAGRRLVVVSTDRRRERPMDEPDALVEWQFDCLMAVVHVIVYLFVLVYGCLSIGVSEFIGQHYKWSFVMIPVIAVATVLCTPEVDNEISRVVRDAPILGRPSLYFLSAFPLCFAAHILYVFNTTGSYSGAIYGFVLLYGGTGGAIGRFVATARALKQE